MKHLLLLFLLLTASTALAATSGNDPAPQQQATQPAKPSAALTTEHQPETGVYDCKYFTVKLPEDWKAFLAPTEQNGMLSALFGKDNQSSTVAITITPHGGLDLKEIADMFAQQYKATRQPVAKNGQYVFNITRNDLPGQVWVSSQGPLVMITVVAGNQKEGMNFLKNNVISTDYKDLFPR